MKCDKLQRYSLDVDYEENAISVPNDDGAYMDASEVDEAIAELKQKLNDAKATAYTESVDAGMENRKLKRALWIARAERASDKARIFYFAETCGVKLNIDGYSNKEKGHTRMCTARWWRITWLKVECKCRAKAEELDGKRL